MAVKKTAKPASKKKIKATSETEKLRSDFKSTVGKGIKKAVAKKAKPRAKAKR